MSDPIYTQILQQLNLIQQFLDGNIAQINAMSQKIENMGKTFAESMASLSENMRMIVEIIRKGRLNLNENIEEISNQMNERISKLWEEKTLEAITKEEMEAINKLKEINSVVSDNLYMTQLMSIIQSIREITGRALLHKMKNSDSSSS
jgi:predicted transcriptional regulator